MNKQVDNSLNIAPRQRMLANVFLLVQTMMWGISFTVMKDITSSMTAISYLAIRFIVAAAIILPFFIKKLKTAWNARFAKASFIMGALLFLGMGLQVYGLMYTSVTNSAFITSTTVILVPIAEHFILKKKISPLIWLGCIIALGGVVVLSGGIAFSLNIGDILSLLCAVSFALQIIYSAKYTAEFAADTIGFTQIVWTAVFFTMLWGINGFAIGQFKAVFIGGILYTAIINTSVGFIGQTVALKYTLPSVASLIYTLEPIFATFFAVLIPDSNGNREVLTIKALLGAIVIFTGVIVALLSSMKSDQGKSPEELITKA